MMQYAVRRLLLLLPLLWGLSLAIFLYLHLIPGDPIRARLGEQATPELVAQLRHQYGLDLPLPVQYVDWLGGLVHGDLGVTIGTNQPIADVLVNRIPADLQLTIFGLAAALLIGLPAGFIAGLRRNGIVDHVLSLFALLGLSTPGFWLGTVLILVVAVKLQWLPSQGYTPFTENPLTSLQFSLLPALTLGMFLAPYLARVMRAATIEVADERFIQFARAQGLRATTVLFHYTLRNAIMPVIVVVGMQLGELLSGQVVIEELFAWPGVGRLMIQGVLTRDYFMVQAVTLIFALIFVAVNLCAEMIHVAADPRIRIAAST
jgi:peptide/nickel transport system permease protein